MQDAVTGPDRWIFVGLIALLIWLPLPWGSKPQAATALFGAIVAILWVWRLLIARGLELPPLPRVALRAMALWLAWLTWCALQVVPLPSWLLGVLSPGASEVHRAVRELPGAEPLNTISILPGATIDQLLLSLNYFALFCLVMVTVARNRPRQRLVLSMLVLCGLGEALYGSIMTLSGWEYGFFEPKKFGVGWATGTFVNRNHLAGYLELAMASGIALVLADLRDRRSYSWRDYLANLIDLVMSSRMRTRVMIIVMVVALVLTRSRMGNIAFFVSLAICGNLYILMRHPKYLLKSLLFFVSMFVIDMLIVSDQYGLQKVAERIQNTQLQTEQRMIALNDLEPVVSRYWLFGAGAGTFGAAFSPYRSASLSGYYDHAHNDHIEFVIESGVVGYGLLCALGALTILHGILLIRRRRDPMAAALGFAAVMALVSLAIHGVADFNLHIPAVTATLVTLMALALSCSSRSSALPAPSTGVPPGA